MRHKNILHRNLLISALTLILTISGAFWINQSDFQFGSTTKTQTRAQKKVQRKKGRMDYLINRLANPQTGKIPRGVRTQEIESMQKMERIQKIGSKERQVLSYFSTWTNAGPNDVGGRIRAIEYDSEGEYLLTGGVHGGIWKSSDEGLTWELKTDAFLNPSVTSIAQDPSNRANWYAFMGEASGSFENRDYGTAMYASGFYVSTDHGDNWTFIADDEVSSIFPTQQESIFSLVSSVYVTNDAIYFCANNLGMYKLTKDLSSFERINANNGTLENRAYYNRWIDLDINPKYGMVAAYSNSVESSSEAGSPAGIFFSKNNGVDWTDITPSGYEAFRGVIGRTLVEYAENEDAFYTMIFWTDDQTVAVLKYEWSEQDGKYVVAVDGYETVNEIEDQYDFSDEEMKTGIDTQYEYNMTLAVHPTNGNIVFAGGTSLYRGTDGFENVTNVKRIGGYATPDDYELYGNHHSDQHNLVFHPKNPSVAVSAHDGGLSRTENVLATNVVWENRDDNLVITQFYHVSIPRSTSASIIGGTQDNGSPAFEIDENGAVSESEDLSSGDGAFQYAGENGVFTSSQNANITYYKITESGADYFDASPTLESPLFVHPFAVSLVNDEDIYVPDGVDLTYQYGLSTKTQKQINSGWQKMTFDVANKSSKTMTAISLTTTNPEKIIYGGLSAVGSSTIKPSILRIIESTKGHSEYVISQATEGSYVNNIAVNPENGNEILVSISNYDVIGLFYSSDGGQNFTNVEGSLSESNISNRAATITKVDDLTVYFIGTSVGAFFTTELNGAETQWTAKNDGGLGYNVVEWLDSRASDSRVVAATHGRGIFIMSAGVATSNEKELLTEKPLLVELKQNYPNPFNPSTVISYSLPTAMQVKLNIYNALGQLVKAPVNTTMQAGTHSYTFDASNLASGLYMYTLEANGQVQTKKMLLVK